MASGPSPNPGRSGQGTILTVVILLGAVTSLAVLVLGITLLRNSTNVDTALLTSVTSVATTGLGALAALLVSTHSQK